MKNAAKDGRVDVLYKLLERDPYLLENLDKIPISDTPLHEAARAGQTHFSMEVASLKPSLACKLNQEGLSPMHLALYNGHTETARGLAAVDRNLVRVKGKGRITALHVVAELGDVDLLDEFLAFCPSAIEDLTVRRETAVHVAVRYKNLPAFKFLFGWLHRQNLENILDWKDEEGDTVLHISVLTNHPQIVELLINNVDVKAKNARKLTAIELFNRECNPDEKCEIREILCSASFISNTINSLIRKRDYSLGLGVNNNQGLENFTAEVRSVVLVVAVLIATATYQAILSPPGGYWQDGPSQAGDNTAPGDIEEERKWHQPGKVIMKPYESSYFTLLNTSAFTAAICTIVVLVMGLPFAFFLEASTLFISCAYFASLLTIFPSLDMTTLCLLLLTGMILLFFHLLAFEARRRKREKRRVGKFQWKYQFSSG